MYTFKASNLKSKLNGYLSVFYVVFLIICSIMLTLSISFSVKVNFFIFFDYYYYWIFTNQINSIIQSFCSISSLTIIYTNFFWVKLVPKAIWGKRKTFTLFNSHSAKRIEIFWWLKWLWNKIIFMSWRFWVSSKRNTQWSESNRPVANLSGWTTDLYHSYWNTRIEIDVY